MVSFGRANELHQARPFRDGQAGHDDCSDDYRNDYGHYQRFGRRENRLAAKQKFPTHRQKRTWRWVFSFRATPDKLPAEPKQGAAEMNAQTKERNDAEASKDLRDLRGRGAR